MRYVLPCFPFFFVWMSQFASCASREHNYSNGRPGAERETYLGALRPVVLVSALAWSVASTLYVYPHVLSYFNELAGGPHGGAKHLLHSNIDWGQDIRYLADWIKLNKESLNHKQLYLAYYGYCDPADIGFRETLPWPPGKDNSAGIVLEHGHDTSSGYYLISTNLLYGFPWRARDGTGGDDFISKPLIQGLRNHAPLDHAGYSISIYKMSVKSKITD